MNFRLLYLVLFVTCLCHHLDHTGKTNSLVVEIVTTQLSRSFLLQYLTLLVACLCHDLGHRGKTNNLMVKIVTTQLSHVSVTICCHVLVAVSGSVFNLSVSRYVATFLLQF